MKIFIKCFAHRKITIYLKSSDSIKDVKNKIKNMGEVRSIHIIKLIFQGREMKNNYILSDYNIKSESELYMVQLSERCSEH